MDGFRNVPSGKIEGVEQCVCLLSFTYLKQVKRQPAVTSTVETNMNRGLSLQASLDALVPVQAVGQEEEALISQELGVAYRNPGIPGSSKYPPLNLQRNTVAYSNTWGGIMLSRNLV